MPDGLIGFGSNLGDSAAIYAEVRRLCADLPNTEWVAASELWETCPVGGPPGQPAYANAALHLTSTLPASELLQHLLSIEVSLGRQRTRRWGARIVDLDLLLYGNASLAEDGLVLPHPRMSFRRFVLEPACAIAGQLRHPVAGQSLAELLHHLNHAPRRIGVHVLTTPVQPWLDSASTHHPEWEFVAGPDPTAMLGVLLEGESPATRAVPGPRLALERPDPEQFRIELAAAIQAMTPD